MKITSIERDGNGIRIIDQTQLPASLVYRVLTSVDEIIDAIVTLKIRGAPAIGIIAAYALPVSVLESGNHSREFVHEIGCKLKASRPTAVNLSWAVDRSIGRLESKKPSDFDSTVKLLWSEAEEIHEEDRHMCESIGRHGAALINDGDSILTHCNTGVLATGGIGTALGVIYTCKEDGKRNHVYVDETRPLLQGSRLTMWELMQEGIESTLICDSAAGMLMKEGKIRHVIVGADRIAKNGDVANKIGTYTLSILAREHDIPFYVAAPSSTVDNNIASGDKIEIEMRSPLEVTNGFGCSTAPDGANVFSPAFDVTPFGLITAYISDKGVNPGGRSA